jgi:hypothetical protein
MPILQPEYQRLPGRGIRSRSVFAVTHTYCRLWQGPDHLLSVESEGYTEDYKRFYYRDIQAIVLRQTDRGKYWNMLCGVPVLALSLIALGVGNAVGAGVAWGFAGLFLLLLAINWLRGPTCVCQLQTAVQIEALPSLNRVRTAKRVIGRLKPLIEQAQGQITAEEMNRQAAYLLQPGVRPAGASAPTRAPDRAVVRHESGAVHRILFYLLFVDALITATAIFKHGILIVILNTVLSLALLACVTVALIRQHESDMPKGLRGVVWGILATLGVFFGVGYIRTVMMTMEHPDASGNQWEMLKLIAAESPLASPSLLRLYIASIASSTALATAGLIFLGKFRSDSTVPPPLAPPPPAVRPATE